MGHLKRCLTLARELADRDSEVFFLCRAESIDVSEHMPPMVREWELMQWSLGPEEDAREVARIYITKQIDAAIIDHYRADEEYQKILYRSNIQWLQFDGTARYPIWADWILNMSPGVYESLYVDLIKKNAILLLGPGYALLRKEFDNKQLLRKRDHVRRILLTFGGGDDRGAAIHCLHALKAIDKDIERVVLMNNTNPQRDKILKWCKEGHDNTKAVIDAEETATHMASADLGITAGGMTVFEMAALGIPLLILQIADNQVPITKAWQQRGYGVDLGPFDHLKQEDVLKETISLMENARRRDTMSETGRSLVDGHGTRRVAEALLATLKTFR